MKTITLAFLYCLSLLSAQAGSEPAKNEFPMVIEGVKCQIKAYQPASPIVIEPMVEKDFRPKSQLMLAIMLTHSDISSYMTDEAIFEIVRAKSDKEAAQKHRSAMKKRYEMTGPSAADNPWKGMKYVVDSVFTVESEMGKFLVYQLATQGGKDINGTLSGSVKNVDGKWMIGGEKSDEGKKFQKSIVELVPAEFAKLHEASSINPQPMDVLLQ